MFSIVCVWLLCMLGDVVMVSFSLRGNAEDRPCIDEAWLRSLEFMNLDIGINVFIWWRK